MNRSDMAKELGISENYLYSHWNKVVDSRQKMGIVLVKQKNNGITNYGIKNYNDTKIRWTKKPSD